MEILEYKGYHTTVRYDSEDNTFIGEVFGITDSLNFYGNSIEELKEMFAQSIENYFDFCKQVGKKPEKEFKGKFNVRISPELHRKAALAAKGENITFNQYISNAINQYVQKSGLA